jgi:hypothetical protein
MNKLPKWMSRNKSGAFIVDPDLAYPAILKALGVEEKDFDQYWIETAYQCAKLAVNDAVAGTDMDPRPEKPLVILIQSLGDRKERWALRNFKTGRGVAVATKGGEAKAHYERVAGSL